MPELILLEKKPFVTFREGNRHTLFENHFFHFHQLQDKKNYQKPFCLFRLEAFSTHTTIPQHNKKQDDQKHRVPQTLQAKEYGIGERNERWHILQEQVRLEALCKRIDL